MSLIDKLGGVTKYPSRTIDVWYPNVTTDEERIMTRQEAIQHIESLFPIDSEYPETNAVGERLLAQAKRETQDWRDVLPDATLIRYAELCIDEDNRQTREMLKKDRN